MLLSLTTRARGTGSIEARLAKIRPKMNSCGLKIFMQKQFFLRIGIICFLAKQCFFFRGLEEKGCGRSFGKHTRPLGHRQCVTKHIFDELSINQSKPDQLSFSCLIQTSISLLNKAGNLLNQFICKV